MLRQILRAVIDYIYGVTFQGQILKNIRWRKFNKILHFHFSSKYSTFLCKKFFLFINFTFFLLNCSYNEVTPIYQSKFVKLNIIKWCWMYLSMSAGDIINIFPYKTPPYVCMIWTGQLFCNTYYEVTHLSNSFFGFNNENTGDTHGGCGSFYFDIFSQTLCCRV